VEPTFQPTTFLPTITFDPTTFLPTVQAGAEVEETIIEDVDATVLAGVEVEEAMIEGVDGEEPDQKEEQSEQQQIKNGKKPKVPDASVVEPPQKQNPFEVKLKLNIPKLKNGREDP